MVHQSSRQDKALAPIGRGLLPACQKGRPPHALYWRGDKVSLLLSQHFQRPKKGRDTVLLNPENNLLFNCAELLYNTVRH